MHARSRHIETNIYWENNSAQPLIFLKVKIYHVHGSRSGFRSENLPLGYISTPKETSKPQIILDYKKSKFGVDVVDQFCSNQNTSRHWRMVSFYNINNIVVMNREVVVPHITITLEKT